jgi:Gas vesicle synthesis protein GvpL/GvpF
MATLYLDDARVRQLLVSRHDVFDAALHRLSGREELGVKAYADPKGLTPQEDAPTVPAGLAPLIYSAGDGNSRRRRRRTASRPRKPSASTPR